MIFQLRKTPKKMEKIDLNSFFPYFSPSFFSLFLFFFSSLLLSLLSRLTLFTLQIGSFHTFFLAFVYSKMTNPFLLFLGGFYSQGRGLKGAASKVFRQLVCKWGGCLGGCSCMKQGEEKKESDGQVGWWEFAWEKKGESDGRGGWLQEVGWL